MLEIIGAVLKLVQMLLGKWFEFNDERKADVKEILKEVPLAQTPKDITKLFDRIHRL
jgi:hypothetical protein